ncbi:unnamed protein product [Paramecium octaurelia]|uniref:Uncharacterized protein n=1 Tax=Paramecium octaurelia TaxID=43137 RepID=A0A8S1W8A4_PAROT|nr:unnamed protein product [Paramecium octaurelia]
MVEDLSVINDPIKQKTSTITCTKVKISQYEHVTKFKGTLFIFHNERRGIIFFKKIIFEFIEKMKISSGALTEEEQYMTQKLFYQLEQEARSVQKDDKYVKRSKQGYINRFDSPDINSIKKENSQKSMRFIGYYLILKTEINTFKPRANQFL